MSADESAEDKTTPGAAIPAESIDPDPDQSGEFVLPEGFENDETAALVVRAQNGDADALNELFGRHQDIMLELARRKLGPKLRTKEDPDDLAQTTFREATRDFHNYTYRGADSLLRWLKQILHNKIRDRAEYYSAGKRDASLETALESDADTPTGVVRHEIMSQDLSVTRIVQRDERFDRLREALVELRPEYRQAITLVFFKGLSLRDAGQKMGGKSEDAVRMMLRRAEAKLGELLRPSVGKDLDEPTQA